jgi:hypothetical protein
MSTDRRSARLAPSPSRRSGAQQRYRLLHSSGDVVIADRALALERLATLPGARLFVLLVVPGRAARRAIAA